MKYALIGCGRIAVNHMKAALNNELEIVAVCDVLPEKMEEILAKYDLQDDKTIKRYTDYKEMIEKEEVPCTACHYCVEHCPKGLDIPKLIALYNEQHFTGGGFIAPMRLSTMGEGHLPCDCIACHSCEKVCPQNIKISEVMKKFTDELLQNDRFQAAKETV